eukprot:6737057-Ditylum_brightwellii.AAC.1
MEIPQECPSKQSWQLWCKAMILWTKTMRLEKPLGRYPENTDWSPTSRCIPVKAITQDSAVTWECSWCSGKALDVNFCQD